MPESLFNSPEILFLTLLLYSVALLVVYCIAKFSSALTLKAIQKQWHSRQTVIAEYKPPFSLSAPELGYIFDRSFSDSELASVVISLAQKGAIEISNKEKGGWMLTPADDAAKVKLDAIEQMVFDEIVIDVPRSWSSISSYVSERIGIQSRCEAGITINLVSKGVISTDGYLNGLVVERYTAIILSVILSLATIWLPVLAVRNASHSTGLIPEFQALDETLVFILLLPAFAFSVWLMYVLGNFLSYVYFRSAGLPLGATPELREAWPEVVGYREFLKTVEFDRLKSAGTLEDSALPYCVALGFDPTSIKL